MGRRWREILNTDAHVYGGSGVGNHGARRGGRQPAHGLPASAAITAAAAGDAVSDR